MDDSIKSSILKQIEESAEHSIFFLTDFAHYGSLETVRKVLTQAHIMGLVSHVAHGIYAKPKTSRFGDVPPSMEAIAKEIAKGGTSLSKGWNLIERFSEDIDIAIRSEGRFAISGTSNTNWRKRVGRRDTT